MMTIALVLPASASESFNGQTFFFGDLHAHTGVSKDALASDGGAGVRGVQEHWESVSPRCGTSCGAMDDVFVAAIGNGLDFMALPDHDDSDEADFDYLLSLSLTQTDILVIPAVELKYSSAGGGTYGHKNMYVFQDDATKLEGLGLATFAADQSVDVGECNVDIWRNVANVDADFGPSAALLWAHHPAASAVQTTDWSCHDEAWEPVVEIYSSWGNALTEKASFDPVDDGIDRTRDDVDRTEATVHVALERGYQLGFVGGTDEHVTTPGSVCHVSGDPTTHGHDYAGGLTIVALDGEDAELTRSAIYDQIVGRQTLVTSGPRIPFQVVWTLAGGGATRRIGKTIAVTFMDSTTLTVRVPGEYEDLVTSVSAVGNDTIYTLRESRTEAGTWSRAIRNATIPSWLYVEIEIDGAAYYAEHSVEYPEGCPDGGTDDDEYLWSSPTWFERRSP